jgi:AbiV family abortive infection protein
MRVTLSARKYRQLAVESLRNSLRLLRDAMTLYGGGSYPTAFQLAVLSLEEYAKAKWVDHVYYASISNTGLPKDSEASYEQSWLRLLYSHSKKHAAFGWQDYFEFSPSFLRAAEDGNLELKKQQATYVGLPKRGNYVDVNSRISLPNSITRVEAKQMISLIAREIKDVCKLIDRNDGYFGIETLDEVLMSHEAVFVFSWRHPSGLKSRRYRPLHVRSK